VGVILKIIDRLNLFCGMIRIVADKKGQQKKTALTF